MEELGARVGMTAGAATNLTVYYFHDVGSDTDRKTCFSEPTEQTLEELLVRLGPHRALSLTGFVAAFCRTGGERGFLLTLDDGLRNPVARVLPLVERLDMPLLLFVSSGIVQREVLPEDQILDLLVRRGADLRWSEELLGPLPSGAAPDGLKGLLRSRLRPLRLGRREACLRRLLRLNELDEPTLDSHLDEKSIVRLARHPLVCLGSHAHSHPHLPSLPSLEAWRELVLSRRRLGELTGNRIRAVAYPFGGHSLRIRLLAALAGYNVGFGTERAAGTGSWPRRYAVLRTHLAEAWRR